MESPECPVCLQVYDGKATIPRVLACGHTACEACLIQLPQGYPHTIRCPACTQLVKYPSQGPSALPKNIDLLRLSLSQDSTSDHPPKPTKPVFYDRQVNFVPNLWSDEFYSDWKGWVLSQDALLVEKEEKYGDDDDRGLGFILRGTIDFTLLSMRFCSREKQMASLVRVASLRPMNDSAFKFSYIALIMNCLTGMKEAQRYDLGLILNLSGRQSRVSSIYGLWGDMDDGFLYLVCERQAGSFLNQFGGGEEGGWSKYGLSGFAMTGMDLCEAVMGLHLEGLIIGCLSLSCFNNDAFGHPLVNLSEAFAEGMKVYQDVAAACDSRRVSDDDIGELFAKVFRSNRFVSPEMLLELLNKESVLDSGRCRYSVRCSSDVWSLACILLRLLIGKQFIEELVNYVQHVYLGSSEKNNLNHASQNMDQMEKLYSLLDSNFAIEFASTWKILYKCLNFDPGSRPSLTDVWKCMRDLIIGSKFHVISRPDGAANENIRCCFLLGELCQFQKEKSKTKKSNESEGREENVGADSILEKDFVEALSSGHVKSKVMLGHLDCVTGLAIGGDFLFSSSYDKTICVWSLQDFSRVHSFRGHEHKIMALVYVVEEQPLCISGDSGGGIFIWAISNPFGQEPLKRWYEEKDWRYSGIHALTVSGTKHLYTGGGDKSIKVWSLLDCTLVDTMNGHKSVVSALAVCDDILYSGSYDGTIRLWCLSDHSPLTVLGEDVPGNVTSILSLKADHRILVATHENGSVKIWRNDVFVNSTQVHNGAIFAVGMEGKWLFTGGWDKSISVQELPRDGFQMDAREVGSINCESIITTLLYCEGKLFVGCADRFVKVYYYGK